MAVETIPEQGNPRGPKLIHIIDTYGACGVGKQSHLLSPLPDTDIQKWTEIKESPTRIYQSQGIKSVSSALKAVCTELLLNMPLWRIYYPENFFSPSEQGEIAQSITQVYTHLLPAFYVDVLFIPLASTSIFIGGVQRSNFVRLAGEHIARNFNGDKERMHGMIKRIIAAVGPILKAKNADWEAHIAQSPFELWTINGLQPPEPGSEQEALWKKENRAVEY